MTEKIVSVSFFVGNNNQRALRFAALQATAKRKLKAIDESGYLMRATATIASRSERVGRGIERRHRKRQLVCSSASTCLRYDLANLRLYWIEIQQARISVFTTAIV